jgi:aryl-alcohol dehydrogenase-like predicted oxidoreductase
MEIRSLGATGVSSLGIGCMGMGGAHGPFDEDEAVATVRRALDLGITLIDTADFYGPGTSEKIVGKAIRGRRDEAVLASKTGMRRGPQGPPYMDGSPEYLSTAVDASLTRLGTDHLDLYYLARVDPKVPIEDSVGALAELVKAGKVRQLGLCEISSTTLRKAHAVHPVAAVQTEYSLWERHIEEKLLPTTRDLGTTLVAYRPLGNGFLTGTMPPVAEMTETDLRRGDPRIQDENIEHNRAMVTRLEEMAAAKGATPSQVALAWVLAQGKDIVPIPGTRSRTHLEQNAAATEVSLSTVEIIELSGVFAPGATAGDRYPAFLMKTIDRD